MTQRLDTEGVHNMGFRWTKAAARDDNLVLASDFNDDYDQYKSTINGGIDRDNLEDESVIGSSMAIDGAFHLYYFKNGLRSPDSLAVNYTSGGINYYGVVYDNYSGGWYTDVATVEESFKEGMATIEFNCWHFIWPGSGALRRAEFEILVDGNQVAYSGNINSSMGQVHMATTLPIASGTHTVSVRWRVSAPSNGEVINVPRFYYDGGALTIINRTR